MEITKAIFYEYKYYLYPENCSSLKDIAALGEYEFKRLKEEYCMAPDFVYKSIVSERVNLSDEAHLFDVEVKLYTREEYDKLLTEQVKAHCFGCANFGGDPSDLEGHHSEISLDGSCYLRESKGGHWSYARCADYFWGIIANNAKFLEKLIDSGNQKKLNMLINNELKHFSFPLRFYGKKIDGTYNLFISTADFYTPVALNVIAFLVAVANREHGSFSGTGWKISAQVPAGVIKGKGYKDNEPAAYLYEISDNRYVACIKHRAYQNAKKRIKLIGKLNAYLNAELGEDVVCNVIEDYDVVPVYAEETALTATALKREIRNAYDRQYSDIFGDVKPAFPYAQTYGINEEVNSDQPKPRFLPFKEYVVSGVSGAIDVTMTTYDLLEAERKPVWVSILNYFYLYVPVKEGVETVQWYLANAHLVPEPIRDPENDLPCAWNFGVADCGDRGGIIEMLVADDKKTFGSLRRIAPVLNSFGVKLVTVSGKVDVYNCGYTFDKSE